ncbi:MAG: redox-regulated ATPase YchF [Thermodesulfobacteriota bacterium]
MGFTCGIVGLPNVGKTTIFNALTSGKAEASNYPFCTINPNLGIVRVPDERLYKISKIINPPKVTPTTLEFLDIAGLVKGASQGEGLGNQFLGHIRNVDVITHVVRCFDNPDVPHVNSIVNPKRDIDILNTELILADIDTVDRRLAKTEKLLKTGDKKMANALKVYKKTREGLNIGNPAKNLEFEEDEKEVIEELNLLTFKPIFYVANVDEEELKKGKYTQSIKEISEKERTSVIVICGDIEAEIAELEEDERDVFLKELGLEQSGLDKLVKIGYNLLKLITFYTTVGSELRAWTVPEGTKAQKAAGKIHSDMEKGFIKAEVIPYNDFLEAGSMTVAKERGLIHLEGREYLVQDGDIIHFRFNP